jgi:hypothetical protein
VKHRTQFLLVTCAALALTSCDDFDVVDKSKDVVISKAEYEQLKAAALQPKQVGRYQLNREGFRTWRLDTVTGSSCLLPTSASGWKGEAKDQLSCDLADWGEAQKRHRLYPLVYDQNGEPIAQNQTT